MTAILTEFARYAALPSVVAAQSNFLLINIFTVVVITAVAVGCGLSLRKKSGDT